VEGAGHLPGDPGFPPPEVSRIPEIARWVAPEFLPVRFDARFYAVATEGNLQPTPDGVEIDRAWWSRADELLAGIRNGRVQLLWPTFRTLEALADCRTVQEVLDLRVQATHPTQPISSPVRPP